jgi:dUTP pyrophosphatase
MKVNIKKLHEDAQAPAYDNGFGMDVFAYLANPVLLYPGMRKLIPTGIMLELPTHTEAQLRPKRELAINCGVTVLDAPQVIHASFNDEIQVLLINLGETAFSVRPGMAIAQLSLAPVYELDFHLVEALALTV